MERRVLYQNRKDSTALLNQSKLKDLGVKDADAPKVLFLSANPEHKKHDDASQGVAPCSICRLRDKFTEAITRKTMQPLKRELKVKTLKLCNRDMGDSFEISTLERNFADIDEELDQQDEELLTFTEVLEMMHIALPTALEDRLQIVLSKKRVPVRQNAPSKDSSEGEQGKKNAFLAYSNNKKLSEICETLSPEEVFAMKEFILKQEDDDTAVVRMVAALDVITDLEPLKTIPGMKDVVFYYIILTMFKESLLSRINTHTLEFVLKGAGKLSHDGKTVPHIQEAIDQLRRYPLTIHPPGICIIFSMTQDREGATIDVHEVRKVFEKELNYDVFVKLNPSTNDVKRMVTELSNPRYMFYDSLVVWFMAHGDKTNLHLKDGDIHRRTEIIQPFVDIPWLKRKPKLFFFQACASRRQPRNSLIDGENSSPGMKTQRDSLSLGIKGSEDWKRKYAQHTDSVVVNSLADTLVSYATMWYQPASRSASEGSLFINTLLDELLENGRKTSIENVLRNTHYQVNTVGLKGEEDEQALWKQTPYYESSLQKEFIFP